MASSTLRPGSHERWRSLALWTGLLTGPLAWLALLQTNYILAYVACETRQTWFMHLATAIAVLLVAAAGFGAWRASDGPITSDEQPSGPLSQETRRQRARWMAFGAVAFSAWFILVILAMEIPIIVLQECQ
jgi:hypothetical protein